MNKDYEAYVDEEDEILARKRRAIDDLREELKFNLAGYRNFLLTLVTISLAVIGAVVAAFETFKDEPFNTTFLLFGITCLLLSSMVAVVYLLNRYRSENIDIAEYLNFQRDASVKLHDKLAEYERANRSFEEYLVEKQKMFNENRETEGSLTKKYQDAAKNIDWWPQIIITLFILGLGSLAFSVIRYLM